MKNSNNTLVMDTFFPIYSHMNRSDIYIDDAKLDYLLKNKRKSGLFASLGYSVDNVADLRASLLAIGQTQPVQNVIDSEFGTKYVIYGHIITPVRGLYFMRTIWMIRTGEAVARFVTAIPQRSE